MPRQPSYPYAKEYKFRIIQRETFTALFGLNLMNQDLTTFLITLGKGHRSNSHELIGLMLWWAARQENERDKLYIRGLYRLRILNL